MRKLIVFMQLSVDGVMQGPGGPGEDPSNGFTAGGWVMPFTDDMIGEVISEIAATDFDLLLGRKTYDIWINYWPQHEEMPIGTAFAKARKYVVTHRNEGLTWPVSERIGGDIAQSIQQLKAVGDRELHVWGSGEMLQPLIAADLVDEYRFWIPPVVLGAGKRLFGDAVPPRALELIETRRNSKGTLLNTYRPTGAIPKA